MLQPESSGVVYEVELEVDRDLVDPFDTWLRDHIADMLQLPGFLSAEILEEPASTEARVRRVVQYRLLDQPALDHYLREHAERMRAPGVARFGERFSARRRTLQRREEFIRGNVSTENCLNCGEVLTGQHCSHCGQRARVRVLSLWGLVKDALGDLTNFDSRIWRTLIPLLFRPGQVTQDYLRGRRASYTPPFRMYLILSIAFFLLATIDDPGKAIELNVGEGGTNLQIRPEGAEGPDAGSPAAPPAAGTVPGDAGELAAQRRAQAQRLADEIARRIPASEQDRAAARAEMKQDLEAASPAELERIGRIIDDPCGEGNLKLQAGPLLEAYEPRLRAACRQIMRDQASFGRALIDNIPKMMFIFLPLMALVMAVLYLGSRRYYVEHLLFFVHFHAFFFLGGFIVLLIERLGVLAGPPPPRAFEVLGSVLAAAFMAYVPWYLYRAMRRVYGQGRVLTLFKWSALGIAYVICLTLTAVGLLFYTALSLDPTGS
jgi:hypothetical protein